MVDVDRILGLLDQSKINREVLMADDEARETFRLPTLRARDHREFKYIVTVYYQHHMAYTGQGKPSEDQAFGEVKRLLDNVFSEDAYQEGYNIAMEYGIDGERGGMREVLNRITEELKRRHLQKYIDAVFHEHVDVRSKADNMELSRAYFRRFGSVLEKFGVRVEPDTFAWNTRAALEYHRQVLEKIFSISKRV